MRHTTPRVIIIFTLALFVSKQLNSLTRGILQDLRELGWIEGQNIVIEQRFTGGKLDQVPAFIQELIARRVEVIFASSTPILQMVKSATTTIPIVFCCVRDPVEQGFIDSLARPGGNLTGVVGAGAGVSGLDTKRLALLKEAAPEIRRVGVLINPASSFAPEARQQLEAAAQTLGVELRPVEVRTSEELDQAFATMIAQSVDVFVQINDRMFFGARQHIADLAAQHRLPTIHPWLSIAEKQGGLMAYGRNWPRHLRHAMTYVDKVLRGADPAELPVERSYDYELIINLKTAKVLGLNISPTLLFQADKVIR